MAKTIRTKVYSFGELSDDAKQTAIENYRRTNESDWSFETECLTDYFVERAEAAGFENPRFQWRLSCSQGDGVSFSADGYGNIRDLFRKVLGDGKETTIDIILDNINEDIAGNTGRYCYASDDQIEISVSYGRDLPNVEDVVYKVRDMISDIYLQLCSDLENIGYKQMEYLESDEYISETMEANEYLFTKDGRIFSY